ncbi:hypothetical protein RJT34_02811 [Clitoria ternatea]|uniref:Uncharacterized protein n=1 Tax=Clitoria ternatea TaxID=43366 RepID=A0AAN9KKX8_CLITE
MGLWRRVRYRNKERERARAQRGSEVEASRGGTHRRGAYTHEHSHDDVELDLKAEDLGLREMKLQKRRFVREQIWDWSRLRASILHQQSRIQWLREGDENSAFFHACSATRKKKNQIHSIMISGKRCEGVEEVKMRIKEYFATFLGEAKGCRPMMDEILFRSIGM